jgi:membrane protease YdiL (CAAX protease family)
MRKIPDGKACSTTRRVLDATELLAGFFVLVFAVSLPLWLIGAVTGLQLLPGLPVSALMVYGPVTAASILLYREKGPAGAIELLKRSFDYQRIVSKGWYVPIILLMPAVTVLTYGLMRVMGWPLAAPRYLVLAALAMFLVFFVAALGEELGWSGYVIDPVQARWNALEASLLVGLVWAAWHWVPLVQAHRSAAWIAWWSLYTVALRVLIVWLYNNTGRSVFAAALFHAFSNVSGITFSGYYDPRITGLIVTVAAVIVTVAWGPRTLARYRHA